MLNAGNAGTPIPPALAAFFVGAANQEAADLASFASLTPLVLGGWRAPALPALQLEAVQVGAEAWTLATMSDAPVSMQALSSCPLVQGSPRHVDEILQPAAAAAAAKAKASLETAEPWGW